MFQAYEDDDSASSGNTSSDSDESEFPARQSNLAPSPDEMELDLQMIDTNLENWPIDRDMEDSSTDAMDTESEEEVDDRWQLPEPWTYTHHFPKSDTRVPVTLTGKMVEDDLKDWESFEEWGEEIQSRLAHHKSPANPYYDDPFQLYGILITNMDCFGMDLKADIRDSAGRSILDNITLHGPVGTATRAGVMITVQRASEKANPESAEKLLLLMGRTSTAAGRLQFLQLPIGNPSKDNKGEIKNIAARIEINSLFPSGPWRRRNLSNMIRSKPQLRRKVFKKLGISEDGEEREVMPGGSVYGQMQIVMWEFVVQDEEFDSLKYRLRFPTMKEQETENVPVNEGPLFLIPFSDRPWVGSRDIHVTLAWRLYKALNGHGEFKRRTPAWTGTGV
ncbi:hypothetical protein DL95DRAFT_524272 [Leptodontidium sp. 2 PMI_412]|nr:hypothetical protein DL95DRAFT_524272 [Leptodontidium sp. 2 PMI_412]